MTNQKSVFVYGLYALSGIITILFCLMLFIATPAEKNIYAIRFVCSLLCYLCTWMYIFVFRH